MISTLIGFSFGTVAGFTFAALWVRRVLDTERPLPPVDDAAESRITTPLAESAKGAPYQ